MYKNIKNILCPFYILTVCLTLVSSSHSEEMLPVKSGQLITTAAKNKSVKPAESQKPETKPADKMPSPVEVAENACAATVGVYCHNIDGRYYGSGFIITADGYILSSTTVVPAQAQDIEIYFPDHTRLPAKLVVSLPELETVVLKVNASTKTLPVLPMRSTLPEIASPAYTAGNSGGMIKLGDGASFSAGLISGIYNVESADSQSGYYGQAIETDAAVTPGQDGGPLLDSYGNVCGIISRSYSRSRFQGMAIPTSLILPKLPAEILAKTVHTTAMSTASGVNKWTHPLQKTLSALVGIRVERDFRPEKIVREDWSAYRMGIKGWDKLSPQEQRRKEANFFAADALLGANQITRRPDGLASGLIVSADGYILTSAFNVQSGDMVFLPKDGQLPQLPRYNGDIKKLQAEHSSSYRREINRVRRISIILPSGEEVPASLHESVPNLGLSLLKVSVEENLPFLDLNKETGKAEIGQHVQLLGISADGKSATINAGIISATGRDNGRMLQFDALLNYGNSGGPLVDNEGKFLGMAVAPLSPAPLMGKIIPFKNPLADPGTLSLSDFKRIPNNALSLAAPADQISKSINSMFQGKGIQRKSVTIPGFTATRENEFSSRLIVDEIDSGSPAWKAGLRKGDELISFEGLGVRSWKEFSDMVALKNPGDISELVVMRPLQKPYLQVDQQKLNTVADIERFLATCSDGQKISAVYHRPGVRLTIMLIIQKGR